MLAGWEPGWRGSPPPARRSRWGSSGGRARAGRVVTAVVETGRTMLDLTAITALAGLVIGALQLSGFTSRLPLLLVSLAEEHVLGLLVLTAVVCVVLGMSCPRRWST